MSVDLANFRTSILSWPDLGLPMSNYNCFSPFTKDGDDYVLLSTYVDSRTVSSSKRISIYKLDKNAGVLNLVCSTTTYRKLIAVVPDGSGFYNAGGAGTDPDRRGIGYYSFDGSSMTFEAEIGSTGTEIDIGGTDYTIDVGCMYLDPASNDLITTFTYGDPSIDPDQYGIMGSFLGGSSSLALITLGDRVGGDMFTHKAVKAIGRSTEIFEYTGVDNASDSVLYLSVDNADHPFYITNYAYAEADPVWSTPAGWYFLGYMLEPTVTWPTSAARKNLYLSVYNDGSTETIFLGGVSYNFGSTYFYIKNSWEVSQKNLPWSAAFFLDNEYSAFPVSMDSVDLVTSQQIGQTQTFKVGYATYMFMMFLVSDGTKQRPSLRCFTHDHKYVGSDKSAGLGDTTTEISGGLMYHSGWMYALMNEGAAIYNMAPFFIGTDMELNWIPSIQ